MKIGVFCPIGNNCWLLSENAPQYMPTFELTNKSYSALSTMVSISHSP